MIVLVAEETRLAEPLTQQKWNPRQLKRAVVKGAAVNSAFGPSLQELSSEIVDRDSPS